MNILLSHDYTKQNFLVENGSEIIGTVKRNRVGGKDPISVSIAVQSAWVVNKILPRFQEYGIQFNPILGRKSIILGVSIDLPEEDFEHGIFIKNKDEDVIKFLKGEEFSETMIQLTNPENETIFRTEKIRSIFELTESKEFILSVQNKRDKTLILPRMIFADGCQINDPSSQISLLGSIWPELDLRISYSDENGSVLKSKSEILKEILDSTSADYYQLKRTYGADNISINPYCSKME